MVIHPGDCSRRFLRVTPGFWTTYARWRPLDMSGIDHIMRESRRVLRAGAVLDGKGAAGSRGAFLAVAGHELRQPLQTLGILNDILRRRVQGAEVTGLLEREAAALWTLRVMLDAVFDFGKAEAGSISPEIHEVAVGEVLAGAAEELAPEAARRGVGIDVIRSSARVQSDPVLLRRLVEMLASAAIGYNDATRLVFGCRRRGGDLRLEVWYAGAGVDPEPLATMLQGPPAASGGRSFKGFAVGIAAARAFTELLEAPLDACSMPGRGGMFAVTLRQAGESRLESSDGGEGNGRQEAL